MNNVNTIQKLLSFKQAVEYLGVSESYLYKLTHLKKIIHYKPGGKLIFFLIKDLEKWALSNRIMTEMEMEDRASSYTLKNSKRLR